MKKIAIIVCGLILAFALTACGGSSSSGGVKPANNDGNQEQAADAGKQDSQSQGKPGKVEIAEAVILDEAGIKVTATGLEEDSFWGPELKLLIENNSGKTLTVQARNVSVNGYMVNAAISEEVGDGKKANTEITFMDSDFEAAGISTITDLEFALHIFDENWETYYDSDQISIQTSAAVSYTQNYDDSGNIVYDAGGIKIVVKGLKEDDFWGPTILTYIENNSGQNICVQVRNTSVNDFMIDAAMSEDVLNGKKAVTDITFFSSDLEKNNIETVERVELSFHIFQMDSWDTIVDTEIISLTF